MTSLRRSLQIALYLFLLAALLGRSVLPPADRIEGVRAFTRTMEFDYIAWILNAIGAKINQAALGTNNYLTPEKRKASVLEYIDLVAEIQDRESELTAIFADPGIHDPNQASAATRAELGQLYQRRSRLGPVAETIIQGQLAQTIAGVDLTLGGQPLPPILYHSTPLPLALIVSPRDSIRQDADVSLVPDLGVEQWDALENQVDQKLNVSSLVVHVGGIGVYPTMVMQTSDLNWLAEVVAHEWVHNYLTLRPLGMSYLNTPELRIMNETTAALAGKEIGQAMIGEFYPELLPPPPPEPPPASAVPSKPADPPPFDFRAEMHTTRVTVDELLAEGKIAEAEAYMEQRRVMFWEQGYRIRKLNQAYFAFYGAYADQPGGAAGSDPVGTAVRALRASSASLADFLNRISWMSSFQQLQEAVDASGGS